MSAAVLRAAFDCPDQVSAKAQWRKLIDAFETGADELSPVNLGAEANSTQAWPAARQTWPEERYAASGISLRTPGRTSPPSNSMAAKTFLFSSPPIRVQQSSSLKPNSRVSRDSFSTQ